jgi:hypothetical protein
MGKSKLSFSIGNPKEGLKLKKAVLSGKKKSTTQIHWYGDKGDTFDVLGVRFKITSIKRMTLKKAFLTQYKREGFKSPEEFKQVWMKFHQYRRHWGMNKKALVYSFARLKK